MAWLWRRWCRRGEAGQSTVELALVLPVVLLLLFGIAEFGRVIHAYLTIEHAAREGARLGITGASDAAIHDRVVEMAVGLDPARLTVSITPSGSSRRPGDSLEVRVGYSLPLVVPLISAVFGGELPLEASLVMRVEG